MYEMKRPSLTHSSGQTGQLIRTRSTSRDSPIHWPSMVFWCVYSKCFK